MFIFLGDSQPLGYELADEVGLNADHIPQHVRKKIYHQHSIVDDCRPDLAYPHLLSESLCQDYVSLAAGGTCHLRHLHDFQAYLKDNQVPKGSTVFLNSNCKLRGFVLDNFTGERLNFMDSRFWNSESTGMGSPWNLFLNNDSNHMISDTVTRIFPYLNHQAVNHISLLCESLGLNFLYFPITPYSLHEDHFKETSMYMNLRPEQIIDDLPEDLNKMDHNEHLYWLNFHPNCAGHRLLTDHLRNVYLERIS